jgi:hypothetical protein
MKKRSGEGQKDRGGEVEKDRRGLYAIISTPFSKLPGCGLMHHEPRDGGKVYKPSFPSSSLL